MKGKGKYLVAIVGLVLLFGALQLNKGQQPEIVAVAQGSGPCEDAFESPVPDNTPNGAKVLEGTQEHNFHRGRTKSGEEGDVDIVAINVGEPGTVAVLTFDLDENVDTVLTLVKDNGEEVTGSDWMTTVKNDNDLVEDRGEASRLVVEVGEPQTLFVRVTNKYGLGGCGEGFGYKIYYKFYALEPEPSPTLEVTETPTPTVESSPTPEPTPEPTPMPTPTPEQEGCWSNYLGRMCQPGEEEWFWDFKCVCDPVCHWVPNR